MSKDGPKNLSEAIESLSQTKTADEVRQYVESELSRLEDTFKGIKPQLGKISEEVAKETKRAKGRVEKKIHENPWAAVGIVGLVFFVLGLLLGLKSSRRSD